MRTQYAHSSILVNTLSCLTQNNYRCNYSDMTLGERLRIARKYAGLTQSELENKSKVPQQTISKIERGDADTSAFVVQLAVACGVRPEWLAMEEGEMVGEFYVRDERLKHALLIMQEMPEYAVDDAIKELDQMSQLIKKATAAAKQ